MHKLVLITLLVIVFSPGVEAAWTCVSNYELDDPFQNCVQTSVDDVVGSYNGLPDFAEFSHSEKQALLFKLEKIFNQIF